MYSPPRRGAPVRVLNVSQSESSRAAQCKQITADKGAPANDCSRMGLCPAYRRGSSIVATKCSLAVIPLVTGRCSVNPLDRRRLGGFLQLSVHRSVHAQWQNRLECIKCHFWVKKKQLFEAASRLAVAQWANHWAATATEPPPNTAQKTQNTDAIWVGES